MKIIGHRGAMGHEPENTLRSIAKAIELGVDMVEVDVFVLNSGEIVVIHDERLDRTTNGRGMVKEQSFDELRALDAGKGEHIPTLDEVISLIDQRVVLNIEVKAPGTALPVAEVLEKYINKGWRPTAFNVSSFNHHELAAFKKRLPSIDTVALMYSVPLDYAAFGEPLGAAVIAPAVDMVTEAFVQDTHRRGMQLYAWVWEPIYDEDIKRLCEWGVDGIFTDFPDQTRALVERYSVAA